MAKTITLLGATYPDVPAVSLPKSGGGTALFMDVDEARIVQISVSATSSTSSSVSNSKLTADHVVLNEAQLIDSDVSYTTSSGSVSFSCSGGIPAMTLLFGFKTT